MTGLSGGERLVLAVLRRTAHGCDSCGGRTPAASRTDPATEALVSVRFFLALLARSTRRRIRVAPPGWLELTADERRVLSLVSSAQHGDESMLEALATWSARRDARPALVNGARALAATLIACGVAGNSGTAAGAPRTATMSSL